MLVNTSDSQLYFYAYSDREDGIGNRLVAFYSCDAPAFYDAFYANAEGNGREDDATDGFRQFVARAEKHNAIGFTAEMEIKGLGTVFRSVEEISPSMRCRYIASSRLEWATVRAAGDFRVSYRNAKLGWESVLV